MRNHMTNGDLLRIRKMIREGHTTADTIQVVVRIPLHRIQDILDMDLPKQEVVEEKPKKVPKKVPPKPKPLSAAAKAVAAAKTAKVDPLS